VTTLHRDASETPPTVGLRWRRDYIRELVRTSQGVIVLANLARIFDPLLGGRGTTPVLAPALL
jgi:purine-binding chemotaxis protein CheW